MYVKVLNITIDLLHLHHQGPITRLLTPPNKTGVLFMFGNWALSYPHLSSAGD